MTVARIAISLDAELARALRKAAKDEPLSAWIADAARRKLRAAGLRQVIEDWEDEHGEISASELAAAAKTRGLPSVSRTSAAAGRIGDAQIGRRSSPTRRSKQTRKRKRAARRRSASVDG